MLLVKQARKAALALLWLLIAYTTTCAQSTANGPVRLSEAYELANVILALTDYGKRDPFEVNQRGAYYQEVRAHFDPYADHPLLAQVNYSREKWESYLSFRTDAYAFAFDSTNNLVRVVDFQANNGFRPFDEHLSLINDFIRQSSFRQFYQAHLPYYQRLATAYLQSQHYDEMRQFLEQELGKRPELTSYAIVISPLVGRMNCHRTVAGVGTDFSTLPDFLLDGNANDKATSEEIASGIHMLFTELDHAFVNPVTEQYDRLLDSVFVASRWDLGSGYEKYQHGTFNEYMTWAVYDLFVHRYFPTVAAVVSQDWALQNETRGFFASSMVNRELRRLYDACQQGQRLIDIYPSFIKRLAVLQQSLSRPQLVGSDVSPAGADSTIIVRLRFSEPMETVATLDLMQGIEQQGKLVKQKKVILTSDKNTLIWAADGRTVQLKLALLSGGVNYVTVNVPWQTRTVLRSLSGIDLKPYTHVKLATN